MMNFTPEDLRPNAQTILFIKQIAHNYRINGKGTRINGLCLN